MNGRPLYQSLSLFALYSCVLIGLAFSRLTLLTIISLWFAGLFSFTLVEYLFHRFFFHMKADTVTKEKVQHAVHGNHHADPHAITGMMMKPSLAIAVSLLLSLVFYLLFNWYTLALLPGFLFGYSGYLFIHFAIHAYKPPHNFLKKLWKLHNLHHFYDNNSNYGVSSPLWDIIFGTYQPKKKSSSKLYENV